MKFVDDDDDDGELNAIVRPSVCRLSVTLVHPTQAIDIFGDISTPFGTLAIY